MLIKVQKIHSRCYIVTAATCDFSEIHFDTGMGQNNNLKVQCVKLLHIEVHFIYLGHCQADSLKELVGEARLYVILIYMRTVLMVGKPNDFDCTARMHFY